MTGSINWQADDAPWSPTSDVDVWGVLDVGDSVTLDPYHQRFYGDELIVDFAALRGSLFQDWEQMSGTNWLACHVAAPVILADPTGQLGVLHRQVAEHHAKRNWVSRRGADAINAQERKLKEMISEQPSMARANMVY